MDIRETQEYILKKQMNDGFLSVGIPALSTDTSARILAVILVHGNNEQFISSGHLLADIEYIQERFHIQGAEVPDYDFSQLVRHYVEELELYLAPESRHETKLTHEQFIQECDKWTKREHPEHTALFYDEKPQWAIDLFKKNYDITLIN